MRRLVFLLLVLMPVSAYSQTTLNAPTPIINMAELEHAPESFKQAEQVRGSRFSRQVNRAARNLVQSGKITRRQALRLRIALLSPAFQQQAEDLAIIQMYFSGQNPEFLPLDENGLVQRASIDWEALIVFLERLIPILLQLLEIFGASE